MIVTIVTATDGSRDGAFIAAVIEGHVSDDGMAAALAIRHLIEAGGLEHLTEEEVAGMYEFSVAQSEVLQVTVQ